MLPKLFTRSIHNPILAPTTNWWEEKAVFNPAATWFEDKIILLYRAIGAEGLSRFGLAESLDGVNFNRFKQPLFEGDIDNPFERLGVEDPRLTRLGDTYYLVYTAASLYPTTFSKAPPDWARSLSKPRIPYRVRVSLSTTRDFRTFTHHDVLLEDIDSKDTALFPEKIKGYYFLLHRKIPSIWLSFSRHLHDWQAGKVIMQPKFGWEDFRIGTGSPPLKTDLGWLLFYHGVDHHHVYRLGAAILDYENPARVLYRSSKPLFEPVQKYEKEGLVGNVVFTCGVVEKDNQYYLYYGAGDKVIGLARGPKDQLLSYLVNS